MPAVREISIDLHELLHGPAAVPNDGAVYAALAVQSRSVLGEGVIYDDRANAVMWTDILGSVLHKLDLNQQSKSKARFSTHEMPTKLGSFGLLQADSGYGSLPILCAWDNGFQIYDVENERSLSEKSTGEDVNPAKGATRLNDGRTDPTGRRFICGGYYGGEKGTTMKVFRVEQFEGKLFHESIVDSIEVANSIAFSPDGKSMYLADSPTKQIHVYDYHGETLSNKKLVYDMTDAQVGVPDGSCVDSEGMIWNAVWRNGAGPGMVQRIHPSTGEVIFTVHMPDTTSQVTCCCFGGLDLDILFITTASENRDAAAEPDAGGLYAVKLPFKGTLESRLDFQI